MKAILISMVILIGLMCQAQSTPPPSPEPNIGSHIEVSTSYERLTNGGGNATVVSARLPVTPRFSAVYSQYQVPGAEGQIYLGEAEFREKASHIFKSRSLLVNLDNVELYARGGLGTKRDSLGNDPVLAYGFHVGADVKIGNVAGGQLDLRFMFGLLRIPRQPAGPQTYTLGNTAEIAPGVVLRF